MENEKIGTEFIKEIRQSFKFVKIIAQIYNGKKVFCVENGKSINHGKINILSFNKRDIINFCSLSGNYRTFIE